MKAVYARTRVSGVEDVAVTTHDVWREGSGESFTGGEVTAIATAFDNYWNTVITMIPNNVRLAELRFYDGYNGDGTPGNADYVFTRNVPGGDATPMCPPQVACSVTELTGLRRHWGRYYLPAVATGVLNDDGTLNSTQVANMATRAQTHLNALRAMTDVTPIVWGKSPVSVLSLVPYSGPTVPIPFEITGVRVDEILDIQRRRRWESTQLRETRTLT